MMFGGNFAPRGWALCDGQLMPISGNEALFALIGTTYGGDGITTFGLPDLRGRVPLHQGQGPGLANYTIGQKAGTEAVTLISTQLPVHNHASTIGSGASSQPATATDPAGRAFAVPTDGSNAYANSADGSMGGSGSSLPINGGSQPHDNVQPFLCVNFCICLEGVFPSRN